MKKATLLTLMCGLLMCGLCCATAQHRNHDASVARNLSIFNAAVRTLEENYVDSVRIDEAFEAALGGMLSTIDPYTEYYTAEEQEAFTRMTTGEYGGIGSLIMVRDSATYISAPMEGSPAAKAGLRAGDKILMVDTVDVVTRFNPDVSKLLRGQPGTNVTVRVARPYAGPDSILDIRVLREKLVQPSVPYWGVVDGSTGYIALNSFMVKSAEEVKTALETLLANPEVKSLVLDLRGNGGGLVESAVDILGYFLPKGSEVLSTTGTEVRPARTYKTRGNPIVPATMPVAVLIDGGSASASEITAGALQDLDRAVIVGSRSFGKGLVQSTFPLPFESLMKVTVAKYLLPSGRLIQALDYSRRNPDGTVARTPDSLTNIYHTRAGREVRDGGGLTPDSTVTWQRPSSLLYQLVKDFKIFDYATRFQASHPTIAPAEEFVVTDSIYADFCSTLDPGTFNYKSSTETLLEQLRDAARDEGYLSEENTARLDSIRAHFSADLERDLQLRRKEISRYIAEEIMTRYYYDRGKEMASLQDDPGLEAAIAILRSPRYSELLTPRKR